MEQRSPFQKLPVVVADPTRKRFVKRIDAALMLVKNALMLVTRRIAFLVQRIDSGDQSIGALVKYPSGTRDLVGKLRELAQSCRLWRWSRKRRLARLIHAVALPQILNGRVK